MNSSMSEFEAHIAGVAQFASKDPIGFLGPLLLAALVAVYFAGILTCQAWLYFHGFPNDNHWLKRLIVVLVIASIVQVIISVYIGWLHFVLEYGNWIGVVTFTWTVACGPVISQLTVALAQSFFAYRSFLLTQRNRAVLGSITFGILSSFALFLVLGIDQAVRPYNVVFQRLMLNLALAATIVTDVAITAVTTWKLLSSRRGFSPNTDNGLSKLLHVTWEAAAPPAVAALINLCVMLTVGNSNFLYVLFNVLVPRLYVFSLMYTLNSRPAVRSMFQPSHSLNRLPQVSPEDLRRSQIASPNRSKQSRPSSATTITFPPAASRGVHVEIHSTVMLDDIAEDVAGSDGYDKGDMDKSTLDLPSHFERDAWELEEHGGTKTRSNDDRGPKPPSMFTAAHFA